MLGHSSFVAIQQPGAVTIILSSSRMLPSIVLLVVALLLLGLVIASHFAEVWSVEVACQLVRTQLQTGRSKKKDKLRERALKRAHAGAKAAAKVSTDAKPDAKSSPDTNHAPTRQAQPMANRLGVAAKKALAGILQSAETIRKAAVKLPGYVITSMGPAMESIAQFTMETIVPGIRSRGKTAGQCLSIAGFRSFLCSLYQRTASYKHQQPGNVHFGNPGAGVDGPSAAPDAADPDADNHLDDPVHERTPDGMLPREDSAMQRHAEQADNGVDPKTTAGSACDAGSPAAGAATTEHAQLPGAEDFERLSTENQRLRKENAEKDKQLQQVTQEKSLLQQQVAEFMAAALSGCSLNDLLLLLLQVNGAASQFTSVIASLLGQVSSAVDATTGAAIQAAKEVFEAAGLAADVAIDVSGGFMSSVAAQLLAAMEPSESILEQTTAQLKEVQPSADAGKLDQTPLPDATSGTWSLGVVQDIGLPALSSELDHAALAQGQNISEAAAAVIGDDVAQADVGAGNTVEINGQVDVDIVNEPGVDVAQPPQEAQAVEQAVDPLLANLPQGCRIMRVKDSEVELVLLPHILAVCMSMVDKLFQLGSGSQGSVHAGIGHVPIGGGQQQDVLIAFKEPQEGCGDGIRQELLVAQQLDHPNCVKVVFATTDPKDCGQITGLAYEFMNGDLHAYCKQQLGRYFTEEEAAPIMIKVAKGVAHLHSKGLIYRDMKMNNTLAAWDESGQLKDIKVADYGVVGRVGIRELYVGSIPFAPPEAFKMGLKWLDENSYTRQTAQPLTVKFDSYALGVMMFEMIHGVHPWDRLAPQDIIDLKAQGNLEAQAPWNTTSVFAQQYYALMCKCLSDSPEDRPSMEVYISEIEKMMAVQQPAEQ